MVFHPLKENSQRLHRLVTQPWVPWVSSRPDGRSEASELPAVGGKIPPGCCPLCGDLLEMRFDTESLSYKWFTIHCLNGWQVQEHAAWQKKNSCRPCVDAGCPTGKEVWSMDNILSNTSNIPASFTYDISSFSPPYAVLNLHSQLVLQTKKIWILTGSAAAAGDPSKAGAISITEQLGHSMSVKCAMYKFKFPQSFPFIESINWFLISENLKDSSPWTTTIFFNPGTDVPLLPAHEVVRIEMDHETLRCSVDSRWVNKSFIRSI